MRQGWRALPKGAQNAVLTVVILAVTLTAVWAASPLWHHHTHP